MTELELKLLAACEAQHQAIDLLLAQQLSQSVDFRPTKSVAWPAVEQGHQAIQTARVKMAQPDRERLELEHLRQVVNHPLNDQFLKGVSIEAEHQRRRWGEAHDRDKSAESWFWLVGYLAGKALRAAIAGDRDKALHHTISSAAALANWHEAILRDGSGTGLGQDQDVKT